jgi:hypothetical protein
MNRWACIYPDSTGFVVRFGLKDCRYFFRRGDAESYARRYLLWG